MKRIAVLILLMLPWSYGQSIAQEKQATATPVFDDSIKVTHVEPLDYPKFAWTASARGIVVIHAKLDAAGRVVSSVAISGNKVLIPDCIANSTKWQFQPNQNHEVVIIYAFRLEGDCLSSPCYRSFFSFHHPNLAVIRAPRVPVNTSD